MENKLPYYMAYPMPYLYDDEKIQDRDFAYLKSLYPNLPRTLLPYVEEECDRMEYEGSFAYDEYPDKLQILRMCQRTAKAAELEGITGEIQDLIEVMICQELYKRRCNHRSKRNKFY
ncbi:MAG: hypothetical protein PHN80_03070 [Hespellia sp.]|nr:hypothetical protein [Hespellia sp.]